MQRMVNENGFALATYARIGEYCWGAVGDPRQVSEVLYKSPQGRFLLVGDGGAMTRWGKKANQKPWSSGRGVVFLEPQEALTWCEQAKIDPDVINRYLGELL